MKNFIVLVKKEIQELLTPQLLIPFVAMVFIFMFIGEVVGKEREKQEIASEITVIDLDQTKTTESIINLLEQNNFKINVKDFLNDDITKEVQSYDEKITFVFPKGFEKGIGKEKQQNIDVYTKINNFSLMENQDIQNLSNTFALMNEAISNQLIIKKDETDNPTFLKNPILMNSFVIINDNDANINPSTVIAFITSQTTFIPIVLFLVITFASQMVATSIATEKENKTLETLLSSPVDRKSIVASKLVAAGLVSLLVAILYLVGMRNYMEGFTGGTAGLNVDSELLPSLENLSLTFSSFDYLLLGISLFSGILAALSIAFILGSFANDSKSAQSVIAPLMIALLIPYLLTMFVDMSTLPMYLKIFIYAIPFTHTFLAAPNILLQNYQNLIIGNLYLWILIIISIIVATKIFSSEKILTLKLKFGRNKK